MIEGRLRWWMTNAIMLSMAIAFLVHFGFIVMYKTVTIQEPNEVILSLEIASLVAIVVFAFLNFIKLARRPRDQGLKKGMRNEPGRGFQS